MQFCSVDKLYTTRGCVTMVVSLAIPQPHRLCEGSQDAPHYHQYKKWCQLAPHVVPPPWAIE
eukprot:1405478-Amphidinium_carterae.1